MHDANPVINIHAKMYNIKWYQNKKIIRLSPYQSNNFCARRYLKKKENIHDLITFLSLIHSCSSPFKYRRFNQTNIPSQDIDWMGIDIQ